MDGLIQQITQTINDQKKFTPKEINTRALKEIVLSGLSRGGFLKNFPYLREFDRFENNCLYLAFLMQDEQNNYDLKDHLPFLEVELTAAGIDFSLKEHRDGFLLKADDLNLTGVIIRKNFDLKTEITYQQTPLAYEVRSVKTILEGTYGEIENLMDARIREDSHMVKEKKGASKSPSKNKSKSNKDDKVKQLSLFDF